MGQPIILKKKGESDMIVYGRAEAAVYIADGWALAGEEDTQAPPAADVVEEPPKTAPKAKAKAKK